MFAICLTSSAESGEKTTTSSSRLMNSGVKRFSTALSTLFFTESKSPVPAPNPSGRVSFDSSSAPRLLVMMMMASEK